MSTRVVSLLLFVSGLCALVFQTAWFREFRLIFGATTPASAAVMAIFMGGLGLGNVVLGKRADTVANPLRLYGQLELAIGIIGILTPFFVQAVRAAYLAVGGQETLGIVGATVVRLALSALVIGPPTFLMGGTLSAAARAVTTAEDESRHDLGWLYGLNTLGAVAGTLLSTFLLLERLGNRETLWLAGALSLANAGGAWWLSQRWQPETRSAEPPREASGAVHSTSQKRDKKRREGMTPKPAVEAKSDGESAGLRWFAYSAAAIVGFAFFLMELVWYRMLGAILGGTTFTFGLILATALTGIGIGGAIYPVLFRRQAPSLRSFAVTCGWEALTIAIPFALGDRLALLAHVLQGMRYFGFMGQAIGWTFVTAIAVLPAAVASGVQFPLLIALLGRGSRDVGRQVGLVSAWNTLGAVLGSLAGGFGLLPLLSAPGAWRLTAVILIGLAFAALWLNYRRAKQAAPMLHPLLATTSAALCLAALGPTAIWRHSAIGAGRARPPAAMNASWNDLRAWINDRRRTIAWEADGIEASVAIATAGSVALVVNGKSDGNAVTDAPTQIMFAMLGAMLHEDPRDCLVIGLGTGESAGWLAAIPSMQHVDVVELEPAVIHVAKLCAPLSNDVLHHPKVRLVFNDAREMVQTTRREYDLIASEPSNPYRSGVSSLYTVDFYQHVRERLKAGGIFVQWLQGYEIDVPTVRMVLTTLHRVFPFIEIWETKPGDMVLVCSAERLAYDLARLRSRLEEPTYREALRIGWRTTRIEGLLAHFVANEKFVARVTAQGGIPLNTDNRNLLEYRFARTVGRGVEFSVAQLREDARAHGFGRPLHIHEDVDWEAALDQLIAYQAALGDPPLILPPVSGDHAQRAEALRHYFQESVSDIRAAWEAQPKGPEDLIETVVLALAYADGGDEKATSLIERLQSSSPVDSQILRALLLERQKKHAEAAAELEKAFLALRTDASVLPRLADVAYTIAAQIARHDPPQCRKLFAALEARSAVMLFNERRLMTRYILAQRMNMAALAIAIGEMEPHVPWDAQFLEMRRQAYDATGNPLAARARRELAQFRAAANETHVLAAP